MHKLFLLSHPISPLSVCDLKIAIHFKVSTLLNVLYCYSHGQVHCLAEISIFLQQEIQHFVRDDFLGHVGVIVNLFYLKWIQLNLHHYKQSSPRSTLILHPLGAWGIYLYFTLNHGNNTSICLVNLNFVFFIKELFLLVVPGHDLQAEVLKLYFSSLQQLRLRQFSCTNVSFRSSNCVKHRFLTKI